MFAQVLPVVKRRNAIIVYNLPYSSCLFKINCNLFRDLVSILLSCSFC
ncbi:MAG: hypothetical protein DDT25_00668 [Chloroflexi bacterium]|nr:hypothetical protein [Chloroflexota bacterium]